MGEFIVSYDCRYFKGDKPCAYKRLCQGCQYYAPFKEKILIIKFGALGDVLRTTPLLSGLKEKYPDSKISWLTAKESGPILSGNPLIDEIMVFDKNTQAQLLARKFDILISLDKDKSAAGIASLVEADAKKGFALNSSGQISIFDKDSDYAFKLGLDDELKFRKNQKTYQQIIFEQAGLDYKGQEYIFELTPEEILYGLSVLEVLGVRENSMRVGLNTGLGNVFCGKKLSVEKYIELARRLSDNKDIDVLLLGGPDELERNRAIKERSGTGVIDTGCGHTIRGFASIVHYCDVVLAGDTAAMHIAIALKKPVVAIFGSTSWSEVDLYQRGQKITSGIGCSPCYKNACDMDEECMDKISVDKLYEAIVDNLARSRV